MTMTQSSGTTLKPQQIAEAFHTYSKNRSQTGSSGSGSQQSGQSNQNRQEFETWFNGFESCLKMVGEHETGSSTPTVNRNEIYTLVEKQQKAA